MRTIWGLALLLGLVWAGCSSSSDNDSRPGTIAGRVEQVLHHGAYNPNGPNKTTTTLVGVMVTVSDTLGTVVDSVVTGSEGKYSIQLPAGIYIVTLPPHSEEQVPGSAPDPVRTKVVPGATTTIFLRYNIYAP